MPKMPQPTYDLLDVFAWYEDEDADGNKPSTTDEKLQEI